MVESIIVVIVCISFFAFTPRTNYFHPKWWFFCQMAIILLGYKIYEISSIPLALFLTYIATSANYYSMNTYNNHFVNRVKRNISFNRETLRTNLTIMAWMVLFLIVDIGHVNIYLKYAPHILMIVSIRALFPKKWIFKNHINSKKPFWFYGFGGNPSVNSTFISLVSATTAIKIFDSPLQLNLTIVANVLAIMALLRMKATSGMVGFGASLVTFLGIYYPVYAVLVAIFGILGFLIINKYSKDKLTSGNGRDLLFKFSFSNFYGRQSKWLGNGIGSFSYLMPACQIAQRAATRKQLPHILAANFVWLHCDAAQLLIDGGYVVIGLLLILLGDIGVHATVQPAIYAYVAAYCCNSLTNFPNHIASDSFLTLLVLKYLYGA